MGFGGCAGIIWHIESLRTCAMSNQTKQAYVAAHELAIEGHDANSAISAG